MQQVWFLLLCAVVSVVYATVSNADNRPWSMIRQALRYLVLTVGALLGLSWLLYFISP